MKQKLFIITLIAYAMTLIACGEDENNNNPDLFARYVTGVEVTDRYVGNTTIDTYAGTITLELQRYEDRSNVKLKLLLDNGVKMVSPANAEAEYNLNNEATVKVERHGVEKVFRITAKDVDGPLLEYKGWAESRDFGILPNGVRVYKSPAQLYSKNSQAYIAVVDMSKGRTFDVLGESGLKTPTEFYSASGSSYPIIINAGYFWLTETVSFILRDGQVMKTNGYVYKSGVELYPTRAAFSQLKDGSFSADWIFTFAAPWTDNTYTYPAPSGDPTVYPSATFPAGGSKYEAQTGIGGGPVLVKDGQYVNSHEAELYDAASGIGPTINNPRTAIGSTSDNKLILFVCEGRNMTPDTPGFTLEETARIMMDLGCVEAINLDGGGSTCMLVNGQETILPSDGQQRGVVTAIGIK